MFFAFFRFLYSLRRAEKKDFSAVWEMKKSEIRGEESEGGGEGEQNESGGEGDEEWEKSGGDLEESESGGKGDEEWDESGAGEE